MNLSKAPAQYDQTDQQRMRQTLETEDKRNLKVGQPFDFVPVLPSYTKTTLPAATGRVGGMIYVTNDTGGAVPAFSDGTDWRRVTDRAVIS